MVLRFSVRATRHHGGGADSEAWQIVEVPCSGADVSIGRQPGVSLELPLAAVSARHARVFREEGDYRIEDLGSVNGTFLGSRRLTAHQPLPLSAGEVIDCGGVRIRFDGELPEPHASSPTAGTETLARRLVHDVFSACPPEETIRLVGLSGPGAGQELALLASERALLVGRGESCDLVLRDEDVSREHAAFQRMAVGVVVRDLQSKNGVEVEGQRLIDSRILHDGELIRIGETVFRLVDPEDRYLRQMQEAGGRQKSGTDQAGSNIQAEAPVLASVSRATASRVGDCDDHVPETAATRGEGSLPVVASALAVVVLLLVLGLVLALAFGCQV
jgi:pSer/pThr/pTyr-binding forkhead associated (FHA) protein